jgi:hypothetical protein
MNGVYRIVLVLMFVLGLGTQVVLADDIALEIIKADFSLSIDGNLDDWPLESFGENNYVYLSKNGNRVDGGMIRDDEQFNAKVYLTYDPSYIYVGAYVVDKYIKGDHVRPDLWQDSTIELWFNTGDFGKPSDPAQTAQYENGDYQINLVPMSGGKWDADYCVFPIALHNSLNDPRIVEVQSSEWSNDGLQGYIVEAAIPLDRFQGFTNISSGSQMKLGISVVHKDKWNTWTHIWWKDVVYHLVVFQ